MKEEQKLAKLEEETLKIGIHKTNQILLTEDIKKFDDLFDKVLAHRQFVEKIEEERNKETENSSLTSSIEGADEEKTRNDSKVPNTPLSGAQKILPEFEEVQAKRSHSIRLNSNR